MGQRKHNGKTPVLEMGIGAKQVFNWTGGEITKKKGKKKRLKKYSFGLKKGAGGIGEKSPSSFYDNQHSKSLHCNLT